MLSGQSHGERCGNAVGGRALVVLGPYALILAVGALTYARVVYLGYTYLDDAALIVERQAYLSDLANIVRTFGQDSFAYLGPGSSGVYYRPMVWVSLILDAQLAGASPAPYHAVNLLLHLTASCLLFRLLTRLGVGRGVALFLGLAFCTHPALVSAVAWIPARVDLLLGVFALAYALALVAFLRDPGWKRLPLVLFALAAALFTKESAVALGAVTPLLVWIHRDSIRGRTRELLTLGAGGLAVLIAWMFMRRLVLGAFPLSLSQVLANLPMFVVYVGKSLLPIRLSVAPTIADSALWTGPVVLVVLGIFIWLARERLFGTVGIGLLWFFGFLGLALLAPATTRGMEHRLYLPLLGMAILLGGVPLPGRRRVGGRVTAVLASLLIMVFAAQSASRVPVFRNDISYWENAAATSPHSARAQAHLAERYYSSHRIPETKRAARRSLELRPGQPEMHLLLAAALAQLGALEQAEPELRAALEIDERNAEAWQMLGDLKKARGRMSEAEAAWSNAEDVRAGRRPGRPL